jgi:hypothetical protein
MQKAAVWNGFVGGKRVYTRCHTTTATGRISLHEPNIQNIPRDFEVSVTPALMEKALGESETRELELSMRRGLSENVSSILSSFVEVRKNIIYRTY